MKLARFIQRNMEQLLEDWEVAAQETSPKLNGDESLALKGHARGMLRLVTEDLLNSRTGDDATRNALGPDPPRFAISIHKITEKFRALRSHIVRAWRDQQQSFTAKAIDELMRFVEAIDQFIARFASSYLNTAVAGPVKESPGGITERKRTEYQVWRHANFDSLTRIANRQLFLDRLDQTLLEAKRKGSSFALLFIDLGYFRHAEDPLGHQNADRLLAQVAERVSTRARAMDTVARLGKDEFTLILKETGRAGAMEAARALLASLKQKFEINTCSVNISPSIGLTLFPDQGKDIDQLMHNADQAMCAAKEHGDKKVHAFEPWMAQSDSEHMRLNRELDDALRRDHLEVYFQPIVNIRTGAISRAEALLRWNHPDRGLLTPAEFLRVTEQTGLTERINDFVLEQSLICSLQWRDQNGEAFPVNINESPGSFATRYLVDQWRARLTLIGLDESWITIELTPTDFINICASGFNPIKSLGMAGLRRHLALDDFNMEPLSLLALEEFSMGSVKIDRKLIKGAGKDGDADRILASIIAMAHGTNVQVVAVGVETDEQLQFLSRSGCDYAQGFLFSRPLSRDDFEVLLTRDRQIGTRTIT